jgi:hypothetical protein
MFVCLIESRSMNLALSSICLYQGLNQRLQVLRKLSNAHRLFFCMPSSFGVSAKQSVQSLRFLQSIRNRFVGISITQQKYVLSQPRLRHDQALLCGRKRLFCAHCVDGFSAILNKLRWSCSIHP